MKIKIATDDVGALMAVLRQRRQRREVTQAVIAASMGVYDLTVQRMEELADLPDEGEADGLEVGRLKDYVDALGGTLRIEVELP